MSRILMASVWLALFFFRSAYAQGLEISPVLIEIGAKDRAEQIVLKNRMKRSISFDLNMRQWSQKNGEEILVATEDFIVSPPVLTIKAGDSRTVRIMRTEPPDEVMQTTYRLILEEIPLKENTIRGKPNLTVALSIPVFADAAVASPPDFRVTLNKNTDRGIYVLTVNNLGKTHARIVSAQPLTNGKPRQEGIPLNGYALPGQTRSWEISDAQLVDADALRIALPGGEVRTMSLKP